MTKSWLNSTQLPLLTASLLMNLLSLPGCGGDDKKAVCNPAPCPSTDSWDYDECTCKGHAVSCDLGPLLDRRLSDAAATDCGKLAFDASQEQLTAARDCVAAALHDKKPLRLVQGQVGADSHVESAYLVDAKGAASVLQYDSDPSGGSGDGAVVNEQQCASLAIKDECKPTVDDLCIVCDQPSMEVVVCHEADG